jgi:5-methylcytosine-specific restriction endonuclease McrA
MPLDRTRHIKKQAAVMKHRRELWVIENGPCQLCGSWENLEVDHRNREDKFSHRIWSYTEEKRAEELAKCRVLCRSCHISRHDDGEGRFPIPYGQAESERKPELVEEV